MWCHCNDHFKTRYRDYKWFRSQLKHVDVSFALSHDMPLSKLSSGLIWDTMALIWTPCNDNAAKCDFGNTNDFVPNENVWMFLLLCHDMPLSKLSSGLWFGTPWLMWTPCNNNAAKCDFGITNDYVSNQRVLMFPLLLVRICCSTNNQVAGDLTLHDAHVVSL